MPNINTIIFDCEGVVVDTETIWDKGQEEFLGRRGYHYDRSRIKPLLTGRTVLEGVQVMQDIYGFGGDQEVLAKERMDIIEGLLRNEVNFIEGFRTFFHQIHDHYKTCIATAMDNFLLSLVDEHLGLSRMFNGKIFTLADVQYRSKPNPDIFLYAAEQIGSKPNQCMVIEDSPYGIEAARRAGMKSTAITTTYPADLLMAADIVVNAFSQIDTSIW
ncbi:HAD family phosphatase [Desulfobulbus sp. F4]|nr:HAD family phosphatase [Desulfobulbus sp. F4]